jgi:hypothetical protein
MDSVISVLVALVIFSPVLVLMGLGGWIVWDMVKSASRRRPSGPSGSFVSRPSGSSVFSDVFDVAIDTGSYGGWSSSCDSGSSSCDSGSSDGGGGCD